ncbi:uncharacterized protein B0H18DRAFT_988378 [Fomitopsis serialis]|uniref:uncharacterized protein n=1 Tax=Fomitopsis serialis TaxID=139415 RepID=UPI0020079130|nr:uncharacterized protein B0H18DRAFT_988378 [Neoantrodia serialis]KAH9931878.1 hypothetical protein B0H18DRAFT_988378 [Neoantrodia serialis]
MSYQPTALYYLPYRWRVRGLFNSCCFLTSRFNLLGPGCRSHLIPPILTTHSVAPMGGNAIWLYGEANATYAIREAGMRATQQAQAPLQAGRTLRRDGLPYGLNMLTLVVQAGPVTITARQLQSVWANPGESYSYSTQMVYDQKTSVSTVIEDIPAISPFFTVTPSNTWQTSLSFGRMALLTNYHDHCALPIDAGTSFIAIEEIRYLVTGLNRTQNYSVTLTNVQMEVVLFDAVLRKCRPPGYQTTTQCIVRTTSALATTTSRKEGLGSGAMAGTIVRVIPTATRKCTGRTSDDMQEAYPHPGAFNIIIALVNTKSYVESAGSLPVATDGQPSNVADSQHRKSEDVLSGLDSSNMEGPSTSVAGRATSPAHEEDAGPVPDLLPPLYNPEWNQSSAGNS